MLKTQTLPNLITQLGKCLGNTCIKSYVYIQQCMPVLEAHDSHIYVFNGKWLWRLNDWAVDSGYPRLARKVFQRAPTNIGAAVYSWRTRYTYFFKGESAFTGIDSVPQAEQVGCYHGDTQTNKPAKRDGRVGPLISLLHIMLIRPLQALPLARIL